jgi:hypothetical protein
MRTSLRAWWPWLKAVLAVAIIGGVAWQFAKLLRSPELWEHSLQPRPAWLALAAILYMLAFAFPALFWHRLLYVVGTHPPASASARAYFIAHLGKYVPGKAWALVLRVTLIRGAGVSAGLATLTAMYETLTLMASGALLAVALFSAQALESADRWKALGLLALAGVPIMPGVFNRLVAFAGRKAATPPPRLRAVTLLSGIGLTACTWALMGLSLGAVLQALLPEAPPWDLESWGRHTAFVALAYVAGFLTLPAPGGLGVRELILQRLLTPELAHVVPPGQAAPVAVVVALLLRLLWTASEVLLAAAVWFLPAPIGHGPSAPVERTDDAVPSPLMPTSDPRS